MSLVSGIANGIFLLLVVGIPLFGYLRKVPVYDTFVVGAKDGIKLMLKLIPYFVGMLVAIGMLRASGAFELIAKWLAPVLDKVGFPAEVLPLALMRPFSGQASNAITAELIHTHGGDAFISQLAATIMGSTETTFYVIAVYFGSVQIRKTRHAIPAGLCAELVGVIASFMICSWVFLR
ncbi:MAG: spore maturation protein [Proteobacteria bacterium]|nr:spore maturation protein [Pseudomonadota bacterium]